MKAKNRKNFYASILLASILAILTTGCGSKDGNSDNSLTGDLGDGDTNGYQPNEIESIDLKFTDATGQSVAVSSKSFISSKNNTPLITGAISFDAAFISKLQNQNYTVSTNILSLVDSGSQQLTGEGLSFSKNLAPGIYIVTLNILRKGKVVKSLKGKFAVMCDPDDPSNKEFNLNAGAVQITPVAQANWNGRPIYLGQYNFNLQNIVSGGGTGKYVADPDTTFDGTLFVQNHAKFSKPAVNSGVDHTLIDISSPLTTYVPFADTDRTLVLRVYNTCYASRSLEISYDQLTATEHEQDVSDSDGLTLPSLTADSTFMVATKLPFLHQNQVQTNLAGCDVKVDGGVNYVDGCDPRVTGEHILIDNAPRISVSCQVSGNTIMFKAEEMRLKTAGENLNSIGNYLIAGEFGYSRSKDANGYPILTINSNSLANYSFQAPGEGDGYGPINLAKNGNCRLTATAVEKVRNVGGCTGGEIKGVSYDIRYAYNCSSITNKNGTVTARVSGEGLCVVGLQEYTCVGGGGGGGGGAPPPSPE